MADDTTIPTDGAPAAPEHDGQAQPDGQAPARRTRRTASRAAGPPQPLFSASAQPAPPSPAPASAAPASAAPPVEDEEPEEPDATGSSAPGDGDAQQGAAGAPQRPATALLFQPPSSEPRRRRTASRPAGAPDPAAAVAPPSGPVDAADAAATAVPAVPAPDDSARDPREQGDAEQSAPPARRSRARSRRAGAPAQEAPAQEAPSDEAPAQQAATPAEADAPAAKTTSRRRSGRKAAEQVDAPERSDAPVQVDAPQGDPQDEAGAAPTPRTRGPRRRRDAGEAAAPAEAAPGSRRLSPGALAPKQDAGPTDAPPQDATDDDPSAGAPQDERAEQGGGEQEPSRSRSAVDLGEELDQLRGRGGAQRSSGADTLDSIELPDAEDGEGDGESGDGEDGAPRSRRRRGGRGRRRRSSGEDEPGDDATAESPGADGEDEPGDDATGTPGDAAETGAAETDGAAEDGAAEDQDGGGSSGRRRRRGRRGTQAPETQGEQDTTSGTEGARDDGSDDDGDGGGDGDDEEGSGSSGSGRRRRRGRSRSGGGSSGGSSGGQPGAPGSGEGDVTAIKGSTRLEAKRQRRREGRESGRRPKVVSEAEFLARRESVERTMVVRSTAGRTQVAVLEDDVLVEHYVARKQHVSMIGDVHLGKVQNVLPSMEAAFVDIGRGRNAVLYAGEVNWEASGLTGQAKRIETALSSGDPVLVQVSKDPVGHKGARLTSQVSLPGRYLVYVPGGSMTGISRKLPDTERARLKKILKEVVPADGGVIVRTAAEGASETELRRDVERLVGEWERISARAKKVSAPTLLHGEPDLTIKVVRDVFNEDFAHLVVDGDEAWGAIKPYVDAIAPDLSERVERWEGPGTAFAHHRVDEQIAKALERKVWLPSGGSLVIDRTEAMTVVDVNTGRFTGSGGNLEETVTRNNLEAAEEIVRQLRLRDVGGIIVVDFIDMVLESNRDLVLRRLVECLGRDRTKHQVAEVTSLGLVQMTRKRVGQGLLEAFSQPCEVCHGSGAVLLDEPVDPPSDGSGSGGGRGRRARPEEAPEGPDGAERSRVEAARDAVRDAIHGVAVASRLVSATPEGSPEGSPEGNPQGSAHDSPQESVQDDPGAQDDAEALVVEDDPGAVEVVQEVLVVEEVVVAVEVVEASSDDVPGEVPDDVPDGDDQPS